MKRGFEVISAIVPRKFIVPTVTLESLKFRPFEDLLNQEVATVRVYNMLTDLKPVMSHSISKKWAKQASIP